MVVVEVGQVTLVCLRVAVRPAVLPRTIDAAPGGAKILPQPVVLCEHVTVEHRAPRPPVSIGKALNVTDGGVKRHRLYTGVNELDRLAIRNIANFLDPLRDQRGVAWIVKRVAGG